MTTQSPKVATPPEEAKLQQFMAFLEHDPENLSLLADTAEAAFDARQPQAAAALLERAERIAPLTPALLNLRGLICLQGEWFSQASDVFASLIAGGHDDPHLRFNLAWARAMTEDYSGALAALDDPAVATSPRGPALKVQMLHHLGRLEDALEIGQGLAELYPHNQALFGALSVVAMDANDMALAELFAARGGVSDDALSTQGMLKLGGYDSAAALDLFGKAIEARPSQPRAWVGKGLALLTQGNTQDAVPCLEKGAALFKTHIGSWIAAGWANLMAKNLDAARYCFETALALDKSFAESHGALAVIDIAAGQWDSAKRRSTVALGLNKQCFSGALAKSLIAEHDNNPMLAQKIRDRTMNIAIGPQGETLAQAIVSMGMGGE